MPPSTRLDFHHDHDQRQNIETQGVSAIESALADARDTVVSVHGQDRFVVMEPSQYQYLRECELAAVLAKSSEDCAQGKYAVESPEAQLARLDSLPWAGS